MLNETIVHSLYEFLRKTVPVENVSIKVKDVEESVVTLANVKKGSKVIFRGRGDLPWCIKDTDLEANTVYAVDLETGEGGDWFPIKAIIKVLEVKENKINKGIENKIKSDLLSELTKGKIPASAWIAKKYGVNKKEVEGIYKKIKESKSGMFALSKEKGYEKIGDEITVIQKAEKERKKKRVKEGKSDVFSLVRDEVLDELKGGRTPNPERIAKRCDVGVDVVNKVWKEIGTELIAAFEEGGVEAQRKIVGNKLAKEGKVPSPVASDKEKIKALLEEEDNPDAMLKSFAEKSGKLLADVERYYKEAKKDYIKMEDIEKEEDIPSVGYRFILGIVKKRLGLFTKKVKESEVNEKLYDTRRFVIRPAHKIDALVSAIKSETDINVLQVEKRAGAVLVHEKDSEKLKDFINKSFTSVAIANYEVVPSNESVNEVGEKRKRKINPEDTQEFFDFIMALEFSSLDELGRKMEKWLDEHKPVYEQEKNSFKVVARGVLDMETAKKMATDNKGMVVKDDQDEKKFMVIVKESKVNENRVLLCSGCGREIKSGEGIDVAVGLIHESTEEEHEFDPEYEECFCNECVDKRGIWKALKVESEIVGESKIIESGGINMNNFSDILDVITQNVNEAKEKDTEKIKVKHPDILEVPEKKNFWQLSLKHYIDLAKKKGKPAIMRALLNLQRWNKKKAKDVSNKAKDLVGKLKVNKQWIALTVADSYDRLSGDELIEVAERKAIADYLLKKGKLTESEQEFVDMHKLEEENLKDEELNNLTEAVGVILEKKSSSPADYKFVAKDSDFGSLKGVDFSKAADYKFVAKDSDFISLTIEDAKVAVKRGLTDKDRGLLNKAVKLLKGKENLTDEEQKLLDKAVKFLGGNKE